MEAPNIPPLKPITKANTTEKNVIIQSNIIISPPPKVVQNQTPKIITTSVIKPLSTVSTTITTPSPSTSKVFIITPEQIAKLGLTQQINKVVESQIKPIIKTTPNEGQEKKNLRISKITIINPKLTESNKTENKNVIESTQDAKAKMVGGMKSKLLNLINSRTVIKKPNELPSYQTQGKRILDYSFEQPSQKIPKIEEDSDVIVLDADETPDDTEVANIQQNVSTKSVLSSGILTKPKMTILKVKQPVLKPISVIQPVNNRINIQEQQRSSEDTKQKIQVLSNTQISLSSDYIKLLKSGSADKQQNKVSSSIVMCKPSNSNENKVNEPIMIEDDAESTVVKIEEKDENSISNPKATVSFNTDELQMNDIVDIKSEDLDKQFITTQTLVLINNQDVSYLKPDHEINQIPSKENTTSNDVIDLTDGDENKIIEAIPQQLITNVDMIGARIISLETNKEVQNSDIDDKPSEIIDISGDDTSFGAKHRPNIIKRFTERIRSKILESETKPNPIKPGLRNINVKQIFLNREDIKFNSNLVRTYSKKISLLPDTEKPVETKTGQEDKNISNDSPILNNKTPTEATIKRIYVKKNRLLSASLVKNPYKSSEKPTQIIKPIAVLDNTIESIVIDDNDDRQSGDEKNESVESIEQETSKPPPKKRGRKKKSEILKMQEELEAQKRLIEPEPEPELETSMRGRKRKVINYCALAEGADIDEVHTFVKRARKNSLSESQTGDERNNKKETGKSGLEEKISKGKKRPGRPKKIKIEENTSISDVSELEVKVEQADEIDVSTNVSGSQTGDEKDNVKKENNPSDVEETPTKIKRRPGRPRKIRIEESKLVSESGNKNLDSTDHNISDSKVKIEETSVTDANIKALSDSKLNIQESTDNDLNVTDTNLTDKDILLKDSKANLEDSNMIDANSTLSEVSLLDSKADIDKSNVTASTLTVDGVSLSASQTNLDSDSSVNQVSESDLQENLDDANMSKIIYTKIKRRPGRPRKIRIEENKLLSESSNENLNSTDHNISDSKVKIEETSVTDANIQALSDSKLHIEESTDKDLNVIDINLTDKDILLMDSKANLEDSNTIDANSTHSEVSLLDSKADIDESNATASTLTVDAVSLSASQTNRDSDSSVNQVSESDLQENLDDANMSDINSTVNEVSEGNLESNLSAIDCTLYEVSISNSEANIDESNVTNINSTINEVSVSDSEADLDESNTTATDATDNEDSMSNSKNNLDESNASSTSSIIKEVLPHVTDTDSTTNDISLTNTKAYVGNSSTSISNEVSESDSKVNNESNMADTDSKNNETLELNSETDLDDSNLTNTIPKLNEASSLASKEDIERANVTNDSKDNEIPVSDINAFIVDTETSTSDLKSNESNLVDADSKINEALLLDSKITSNDSSFVCTEPSSSTSKINIPKRRGRKRKIINVEDSEKNVVTDSTSKDSKVSLSDSNAEGSNVDESLLSAANKSNKESVEVKPKPTKGRIGRPRLNKNSTCSMIDTLVRSVTTPCKKTQTKEIETESDVNKETVKEDQNDAAEKAKQSSSLVIQKGRRGRKKKTDITGAGPPTSSDVTCAVCNQQMPKNKWGSHKLRSHNNLTWKVGDPPLDLHDERLVMNILSDIYRRKKPLYCDLCGTPKKSVMGFLSHKAMCQKTTEEVYAMRVKCEYCDRTVLPVSMSAHLKYCKKAELERFHGAINTSMNEPVVIEGKRRAATKANDLIKSIKEDDTTEQPKIKKPRYSHMWIKNYDFQPNYFAKKRFACDVNKNGSVDCRFEECDFNSSNLDEYFNHLFACDKKPKEGYTCKYCIITYNTEEEIKKHLQESHTTNTKDTSDNDEPNEEDDNEEEEDCEYNKLLTKIKPLINKSSILHGIKFLLKNRYCTPSTNVIYPPAYEWMLKFCKENYSIPNLFPKWRLTAKDWETLDSLFLYNYIPQLKYSICTAKIRNKTYIDPLKHDHEWKRYKLFESCLSEKDAAIFFCGGPILSMAWAPTPYNQTDCKQILAVSTNTDINKEYMLGQTYSEPGLIQFWNCGNLKNYKELSDPPKLEFCIAHDYGPIWCLEWCPSGCYDIKQPDDNFLQRLGMLAVGAADACVYLYSVCFPIEKQGKIVKPQPVAKLQLDSTVENTANDLEAHVTRISWSKSSGHQYVLVGYANGLVAIFDLSTTSRLLLLGKDQNEIETIMPYRIIPAHDHAVTALSLYHLHNGRRWIMTGSIDRTVKYWDLENPAVPITNFVKFIVTDGVWLNFWLSNIICFDDSCSGGLTATLIHQLRNYESDSTTVMYSNSCVVSISGNEWLNGFVQSNVVGEITGFFPHQLFCTMDSDKSFKNKKMILGYSRLVPKALTIPERLEEEKRILEKLNDRSQRIFEAEQMGDIQNIFPDNSKPEPSTYAEAEEKYGLVFCDMIIDDIKEFPDNIDNYYNSNKSHKLCASRPVGYPLESINKVVLNPNKSSYSYLAAGYQTGFVRISSLNFTEKRIL